MPNPRWFVLVSAALLTWPVLAGCSSKNAHGYRLVPVTGVVRYNGQPLADAHVTFTNTAANVSAYARSDANGRFTLTTFEPGDGAVSGHQTVSVSKVQVIVAGDPNIDRTTTPIPRSAETQRRWLIPERYGSMETSGLTAEVTDSGKNEIVLELVGDIK